MSRTTGRGYGGKKKYYGGKKKYYVVYDRRRINLVGVKNRGRSIQVRGRGGMHYGIYVIFGETINMGLYG